MCDDDVCLLFAEEKKLGCLFWFSTNWIEIGLIFFFANLFRDKDMKEGKWNYKERK